MTSSTVPPGPVSDQGRQDAYQTFARLAEEEWTWRRTEFPDRSLDEPLEPRLPDVGPEAQSRRTARWIEVLARLDDIDRSQLSPEQAADFDVYRYQITTLIGQQTFRLFERPANADSAFWMDLTDQSRRRLGSADDGAAYIEWLHQIPRYIDQNIENMRAGARRGFAPAQISMAGREATIRSVAESASAEDAAYLMLHRAPCGMSERWLAWPVAGHTTSAAGSPGGISTTALAARAFAESVRQPAR
jgi:uncharacterized protein (DUF885 family)